MGTGGERVMAPDEHLEQQYEDRYVGLYTDDPSEDPDDPFWDDEDEDEEGQEGDGGWEAFNDSMEPDTIWEARGEK